MAAEDTKTVGAIRQLERDDLPEFVATLTAQFPNAKISSDRMQRFLERTLIDNPWADREIPSLVYVESGRVLGTIGSSTRRMMFDGKPIRVACCAYLWADPRVRSRGVGAQLLRALLSGPQDLTITDAASETVRRMWENLGGQTFHLSRFSFNRIFRPWQLARGRLIRDPHSLLAQAAGPPSSALDRASARVARWRLVAHAPEGSVEALTPSAMVEHLPVVTRSLRLVPDYDVRYLEWLFGELETIDRQELLWLYRRERGQFMAELVRRNGRALGWYACHTNPGGLCRVLQVAASPRTVDVVLDHLCYRAWQGGAAALVGRIEPHLVASLSRLPAVVRYSSSGWVLVHSRDRELTAAILGGDALLTRLDAEWWVS